MSIAVPTGAETTTAPKEYKSGAMNETDGDGNRDRKVAFITGVTGQDGSYLVELLLSKGAYVVCSSSRARAEGAARVGSPTIVRNFARRRGAAFRIIMFDLSVSPTREQHTHDERVALES